MSRALLSDRAAGPSGQDASTAPEAPLDSSGTGEKRECVNAPTANPTPFFPESHHFSALEEHLASLRARPRINIWCCAAATGEEPYGIAMTALKAAGGGTSPARILATDINAGTLAAAGTGDYPEESVARLEPEVVRRYFLRGSDASDGRVRVRPEVAGLVTFRQVNLLARDWPLRPSFDAIFCRKALTSLDETTRLSLVARFAPLLNPGGLLFVGQSEDISEGQESFRLRGRAVYEVAPAAAWKHGGRPGNA